MRHLVRRRPDGTTDRHVSAAKPISLIPGQHVRNMSLSAHNQIVLDALLRHQAVRQVANFGDGWYLLPGMPNTGLINTSAAFQLFAPRLHDYYDRTLTGLCTRDPSLRRNFERNVFANATFNLGPRTVAYKHRDNLNLPWGWCAITAIGSFNPHEGGHLVLWELRMVIEFPPGATVLIPSAIITHGNTSVADTERRYSFTQYSAGGIFRWVDCGYQAVKALPKMRGSEAERRGAERWKDGVEMMSMWSEFAPKDIV